MADLLAIFAKCPAPGKVKTRLALDIGEWAATELYRAMLVDVERNFEGAPFYVRWWVSPEPEKFSREVGTTFPVKAQCPGSLGARLRAAVDEGFAEGMERVAVIGADCPTLGADEISALFEALADNDISIIPAGDGGYAALSLKAPCPAIFEGVEWSSPRTLEMTLERAQEAGLSVALLPPLEDIDDLNSLNTLLTGSQNRGSGVAERTIETLEALGFSEGAIPVIDDLGGMIDADGDPPKRIISLVPSITETLFDLGLGERVVGRTDFCIYPEEEVKKLPPIGGPKDFDPAAVIALGPDLVLCDAEENYKEGVEALRAKGIKIFVALPRTLISVASLLMRLGRLLKVEEIAAKSAREIIDIAEKEHKEPLPVLCPIWRDPWMSFSDNTYCGAVIRGAGLRNIAGGLSGAYPELYLEELPTGEITLLLLPSEPYPFTAGDADELAGIIPLAAKILFPGEWLTWYGARTAERIKKLAELVEEVMS
ncbi:MAG: hypothetical protein C0609_11790 [Deltaproteobacteria bacterium]|nr:MAG: hypothetical protein C0609_11790 [Deltaproteobacteria bacterium]